MREPCNSQASTLFLYPALAVVIVALAGLYVVRNDAILLSLPARALSFSPLRCEPRDVLEIAEKLRQSPKSVSDQLPPVTGRRYIVVGGAGFLGGWIVIQLLQRGEDPRRIRVLDLRPPTRPDLTTGLAKHVQFLQVDITNAEAIDAAFKSPWPSTGVTTTSEPEPKLTVFNSAANIRFFERHPSLLPLSSRVNVEGTKNVINAARSVGADILVYTSSGAIAIHNTRFLLWPWESEPRKFVQVIDDDDDRLPKRHRQFFSNYAFTKSQGENVVREADRSPSGQGIIRTGCIRPGCGVYGPGGDISTATYLKNKTTPTWVPNIIQSWVYVENCSLAHLLYEQRLIEMAEQHEGPHHPDIGGQSFTVTNPGPPATYGDMHTAVTTLTDGECTFPRLSPTFMLFVAHVIELYSLIRHFLLSRAPRIGSMLPSGLIMNVQPAMFALASVHVICDDSRARLPPHKGGLGYKGSWMTIEGFHTTIEAHLKTCNKTETPLDVDGGSISRIFNVGLVSAESKTNNFDGAGKVVTYRSRIDSL